MQSIRVLKGRMIQKGDVCKKMETDNLKQAYELAYRKACQDFPQWDSVDMATSSGCSFDPCSKIFSIQYVNENYKISFPSGDVAYAEKNEVVPITVKIVLLHYLVRAGGQPLKNSWISFKDISPGGMLYSEPFAKRVTNYLSNIFGNKPQLLLQAGMLLGGTAATCGDYSVQINILPRLPVIYGLWAGDEEFAPRATVLFDVTAPFYLPIEDLVVATAFGVGQLSKAAKGFETLRNG